MPILELQHVKGDLRVTAFASNIVQEHEFFHTQRLIFRNISKTVAMIEMHIKPPFEVVALKTCGVKETSTVAAVQPGTCVEVSYFFLSEK